MHRRGSIFLFILGVMGVLFALAFSLLSSSQLASTSGFETDPEILARQAAREGLDHAIGVIHREFTTGAGIPSTLDDDWRTHFWAIDTHRTGEDTSTTGDDRPRGHELNPWDLNENDVHVENLLTEYYCGTGNTHNTYRDRQDIYARGYYTHPGTGRWFEPGVRSDDPVAQPLSFHLEHPAPANAASPDPALRAGENYAPDVFEPVRYDARLRATDDPTKVRYRLRYAVAVESLDGHILISLPDEYDAAATSALSGTPTQADFFGAVEVDNDRAERYAGAIVEMLDRRGEDEQFVDLGFRGLGFRRDGDDRLDREWSIAAFDAAGLVYGHVDWDPAAPAPGEPNRRIDQTRVPKGSQPMAHELLGPIPSFDAFLRNGQNDRIMHAYVYTPFGRAPQASVDPVAWDEGYVDTPWRINFPTASPQAIVAMLYAYLPQEFRSGDYPTRTTEDYSVGKDGWTKWINKVNTPIALSDPDRRALLPGQNLFVQMAGEGFFDRCGGIDVGAAYPGTDPNNPGAHWQPDLGAENPVNSVWDKARMSSLGTTTSYTVGLFGDFTEKQENWVGGVRVRRLSNGDGRVYTRAGGFYYEDSYWLDLAQAFGHAMAAAQYAWTDRVSGAYTGDPLRGIAVWDPSISAGYFPAADAPGFSPGTPCRDLDLDGDGVADVPSAFDTVAELDAQFVRNLGEWPGDHATGSRPEALNVGLEVTRSDGRKRPTVVEKPLTGVTIKKQIMDATITPEQGALMELVINDMRMSFFGASAQYPDFRPLDFDDDGVVRSSAYTTGFAAANAGTGRGPEVDQRFSLTGYFTFQKSRYYRLFVRGEVFDQVRNVPVAQCNRETVYVVDPDGDMWDVHNRPAGGAATGMADSHVLFERSHNNAYRGFQSHVAR